MVKYKSKPNTLQNGSLRSRAGISTFRIEEPFFRRDSGINRNGSTRNLDALDECERAKSHLREGNCVTQSPPSVGKMFLLYFVVVLVLVLVVWALAGWIPFKFYSGKDALPNASLFGQSFGFVNSLFSGVALAGVVATLLVQIQALRRQHEERLVPEVFGGHWRSPASSCLPAFICEAVLDRQRERPRVTRSAFGT